MTKPTLAERMQNRKELDQEVLIEAGKLLEADISKTGNLPVMKCQMGRVTVGGVSKTITSYIGTRNIRDLSNDALFKLGIEMDFMKSSFNEKGHLIVDKDNIEVLSQRQPDFSRQISMTSYLLRNKYRKFGTILVVVSPNWVSDPAHENWDQSTGRAKKTSINFTPLIPSVEEIGVINTSNVDIFALDGQHRLIGMRGLKEVASGRIYPKNKMSDPKKEPIEKEDFLEINNATSLDLDNIFDEGVTVEYLPAVIEGETMAEAIQRIRSVFVAINKNAKKPLAGETYALDEDDGFAIVARQVGQVHRLFQATNTDSRVNWKNTSIPKRSNWIITLQHLRELTEIYLKYSEPNLVNSWANDWGTIRPEEVDLDKGNLVMSELFDQFITLPTCKRIMSSLKGDELDHIRLVEHNILTRPIGYKIVADAVGQLIDAGETIDNVFDKLRSFDSNKGFEQNAKNGIWYGVTFDPKERMLTGSQSIAADLIKWTLFGQTHVNGPTLSNKCMALRRTDTGEHYYSFDGSTKPYSATSEIVDLPQTII
jgi:hypothetical protein